MYVDTSVLVAYYTGEELGTVAEKALLSCESPAVSGLSEVELFAALGRKMRAGEIDDKHGRHVRTRFLSHLEGGNFSRVAPAPSHFLLAREWLLSERPPLACNDAIHLAVTALRGEALLTADRQQARAAEALGIGVELLAA